MIKRTLLFSNPVYLSTKLNQLHIQFPYSDRKDATVPLEDIGVVVLESPQITITSRLLTKLTEYKSVVILCDEKHLPVSILHPFSGHTLFTKRLTYQLNASKPLQKNLWKQTVQAKIRNQALHLKIHQKNAKKLERWVNQVKSGDSDNIEGSAAAYYFKHIFELDSFTRDQFGLPPNHWMNYGYAILRALTARSLTASGLLPALGIWHHNKYNPYCLADDIMEPYRPFVDLMVADMLEVFECTDTLEINHKSCLLKIPAMDVIMEGKKSPLMVAMSRTTNSLYECFEGSSRRILYPTMMK